MTGLMKGKRGLIMGLANDKSLAWGIAKALHAHGAELAISYQGEVMEKRVKPLAEQLGCDFLLDCDVADMDNLDAAFATLAARWPTIDFVVHAIGYTNKEALRGHYADVTLDGSGVAALTGGPFARVVYGKAFTADFKSVKLAYAAQLGDAVGQTKMVHGAGLVLHKSCLDGILVGPDFDHLEALPQIYKGAVLTPNQLIDHYDQDIFPINAEWTPDARLVVRVNSAEGPVTVQGVVIDVETRDGAA